MTKCFLFFVFTLLVSFSLRPQTTSAKQQIDSLYRLLAHQKQDTNRVNTYCEMAYVYSNSDTKKSIVYSEKSIALALKIKWRKGIARGYFAKAETLFIIGAISEAIAQHKLAEAIYRELNDPRMLAYSYYRIGSFYAAQGKYNQALKYTYNYLRLSEKNKSIEDIAFAYNDIANIHDDLKQFDSALKNYGRALSQFKKINDYSGVANTLLEISIGLDKKGYYKASIGNGFEALKIYKKLNDPWGIAFAHSTLGSTYNHLKEYKKALYFLQKAIAWYEYKDYSYSLSSCYEALAVSYLNRYEESQQKDYLDKAYSYATKAIQLNQEINNLFGLAHCYETLSNCYQARGDYQKALEASKKVMDYRDSIYTSENKETVRNLADQHTIEVKQKEIQIAKLSLEVKERQKWILMSGIGLLFIILSLIFYQSRSRKKINSHLQSLNTELDASNKIKLRFFGILNHDLRSPVASLINFLHLQKENPELLDDESRKRIELKTIKSAENLLNSMEDILLWSKGQMEHFKPHYAPHNVSSLFQAIRDHFSSVETVHFQVECPAELSLTTDENYLKTILRNLTGNAIKALENRPNAALHWKAWEENQTVYLSLSDNGVGATPRQFKALYDDSEVTGIKSGLGLHLIRDLAAAIHCSVTVDTQANIGTTFTLMFHAVPQD